MELLADRDPEEARKVLDPVLERMMEAVHHYEGTVNQVMGDCWEAPKEAMRRDLPSRGCARDHRDVAQPLSYLSWWRHQTPASLRPLGARSSHWYMPQRPSSPRA